jgi:hypothetical protein
MKEGVEVQVHEFLISIIDGDERQVVCADGFTPGQKTGTQ